MQNIFIILKHNIKSIIKNWFWIVLLLPIVVNVVISKVILNKEEGSTPKPSIAIFTNDKSKVFDKLINQEKFDSMYIVDSEKEVKDLVNEDEVSAGLIIKTDDIFEDIKNNKENVFEFIGKENDYNKDIAFNIISNEILKIESFGDNKEDFIKQHDNFENEKYKFNIGENNFLVVMSKLMTFGFYCMAFLLIAGKGLSPLIKERESKIDKRILVSKVSKVEYLLGHIIGCFLLLSVQSIVFAASFYIFNKGFEVNFYWMILLSIVLSFVATSMVLLVLVISNTSEMYYALLTIIIMPACLLSGGFISLEFMPEIARKIAMFSPITWINTAFKNIVLGESANMILMNLGVAIAISILMIMLYLIIENNKKHKYV